MVTTYKPQLNHIGFDWFVQSNRFHRELVAREPRLLTILGFYEEHDINPGDPWFAGHVESMALINEMSGILSVAATIRMDSGFKAPHQIIATLKAIEINPSVIITHAVEPEALGTLASCYQRGDELPGTFWLDIDRDAKAPLPELDRVRAAASKAIALLKMEASPGRRKDKAIEFLALRFREMFLRFNDQITRHSVESARDIRKILRRLGPLVEIRSKTKQVQRDAGPFVAFLELVLEPLNLFFRALPKDYGAGQVSAGYVAELLRNRRDQRPQQDVGKRGSLTRLPNYPHNFHRESRGVIQLSRQTAILRDSTGEDANDHGLQHGVPQEAP